MRVLYRRYSSSAVAVAATYSAMRSCQRLLSSSSPRDEEEREMAEAAAEAAREEDELRELQSRYRDDEHLPLLHVMARKADALERDLQRLRWCLYARPQLLADTAAATLSGRPTRIDVVLRRCAMSSSSPQQQQQQSNNDVAGVPAAQRSAMLLRYARWTGTSSPELRLYGRLRGFLQSPQQQQQQHDDKDGRNEDALATQHDDVAYKTRVRKLHALNYYSRLNLTPKRHIGHALYHIAWNAHVAAVNALGCVVYATLRGALRDRLDHNDGEDSSARDDDDSSNSIPGDPRRRRGGVWGLLCGAAQGVCFALQYLVYGWLVSPYVHVTRGLCNSCYGPLNAFTGRYMFDASSGRWQRCTVVDAALLRRELRRDVRVLHTIGRYEFQRKRMHTEQKWRARMALLGFSYDELHDKLQRATRGSGGGGGATAARDTAAAVGDPYDVLHVSRNATTAQIKAQYKKLAMIYHPDVVAQHRRAAMDDRSSSSSSNGKGSDKKNNDSDAHAMFARVSSAYQILSNAERRRAYDRAGVQGLRLYESRYGSLLTRTPAEMVQTIFGGEAFRRYLLGDLLRTHWSLRYEAAVSVSMHEFEELQCLRVRLLAVELARMADAHAKCDHKSTTSASARATASSDATAHARCVSRGTNAYDNFTHEYEQRCERFAAQLAEACFGKELLYEVGEAYVVSAQRYLGVRPFYAPKLLQTRKALSGIDRVWDEFRANMRLTRLQINEKFVREFLSMEFDTVITDVHVVLRLVLQLVLCDAGESAEVRRRRCYAVWLLGETMMARGQRWNSRAPVFALADLLAYVQQAATSPASTRAPHAF